MVHAVQTPLRKSSSVCSCVLVQTSRKKACVALLNASHTQGKLKQGWIFKYFQKRLENLLFESDRQTNPATTYSPQNAVNYVDPRPQNLGIWNSTSWDLTLCANSAAHRHQAHPNSKLCKIHASDSPGPHLLIQGFTRKYQTNTRLGRILSPGWKSRYFQKLSQNFDSDLNGIALKN